MSDGAIELPYTIVRDVIQHTAKAVGCHDVDVMTLGQTAWHLQNRGFSGVVYVLRYLALLLRDPTLPRLAVSVQAIETAEKLNSGARRTSSFVGLPAPLIILPAASFRLDETAESDGILFTCDNVSLVYSKTHGTRILGGDPADIERVDAHYAPTCTASRVDYADGEGQGMEFRRVKNETLILPAALYRGPDSALDVDLLARI